MMYNIGGQNKGRKAENFFGLDYNGIVDIGVLSFYGFSAYIHLFWFVPSVESPRDNLETSLLKKCLANISFFCFIFPIIDSVRRRVMVCMMNETKERRKPLVALGMGFVRRTESSYISKMKRCLNFDFALLSPKNGKSTYMDSCFNSRAGLCLRLLIFIGSVFTSILLIFSAVQELYKLSDQRHPNKILEEGAFGYVRHPVAGCLMMFGVTYQVARCTTFGIWAALYVILYIGYQTYLEERFLIDGPLSDTYLKYKGNVPAMFIRFGIFKF